MTGNKLTEKDWIIIGKILKPRGLSGELKVQLLTDFPDRFGFGKTVLLKKKELMIPCLITGSQVLGDFAYIRLDQIQSIEETKELIGETFVIPFEQLAPPEEGAYYPFQLIGLNVFTEENEPIGQITEIYTFANQSIYEIQKGKKEYLIPATKNFVKKIDLIEKKIIIHVVEGLLDSPL